MSFEASLPKAIQKAKWKLTDLKEKLEKGTHQCDCEFCDIEDESGLWPDEVDEIERQIVELEKEIKRMEQYARDKGLVTA